MTEAGRDKLTSGNRMSSTEISGTAPIALGELNKRLASLEDLIKLQGLDMDTGHSTIDRARAIVLANLVFELANPLLLEMKNTKRHKNLKTQVRLAAIRFAEYSPDDITKKIQELKQSAGPGGPGAIAILRQIYGQDDLPHAVDNDATHDIAEATVWHVYLNHNPVTVNPVH